MAQQSEADVLSQLFNFEKWGFSFQNRFGLGEQLQNREQVRNLDGLVGYMGGISGISESGPG